jgi:DNA repair protein RecO (recombination protein O)
MYLCAMLVKTTGLVLRSLKYGETSMIVDIYSRDLGMQSYIVQGVRKVRSRLPASLFQVGNFLKLVVYHQEKTSLKRLKEAGIDLLYTRIHGDIRRSTTVLFLVELLRNVLRQGEASPPLFEYLESRFRLLDEEAGVSAMFLFETMLTLSAYMGFFPGNANEPSLPFFDLKEGLFTSTPPPHPDYLSGQPAMALGGLLIGRTDVEVAGDTGRVLLDGLLTYYRLHLEPFRELRSREILREVLRV